VWNPRSSIVSAQGDFARAQGNHVDRSSRRAGVSCPAIVLSHGAFGAASNYTWIAEALASRGIVVIGVSHFGESFAYGLETIDPGSVTRPWDRALDLSFALDLVLEGLPLGDHIDPTRVGAIGHSSGGATALQLGGAVFDAGAMGRYCASPAAVTDLGCAYACGVTPTDTDVVQRSLWDGRVRAIVAMDPALGPGHEAGSLAAMAVPVHIVAAVDNDFLPFSAHAAWYASHIPGASLTRLDDGEGHFVFLDMGDSDREASGVPLYRDRPGVNRALVHERVIAVVTGYLEEHLGVNAPHR
jgi:predicted dienelactone hydrolase